MDPIEEKYLAIMNAIGGAIDDALNGEQLPGLPRNKKNAFVLLVAEFGHTEGGRVNYISNGNRDDMRAMMHETLARMEGRYHEEPKRTNPKKGN